MGETRYTRSHPRNPTNAIANWRFFEVACALPVEVFRPDPISLPTEVQGSVEADFWIRWIWKVMD
jgi:hypothetical protein